MSDKNVPIMIAIQEKETELKARTLEAKRAGEKILADARKEAAKIRQTAVDQGEKKAAAMVAEGLAKANADAERTLAATQETKTNLGRLAKKNLDRSVALITLAVTGRALGKDPAGKVAMPSSLDQEPAGFDQADLDGGQNAG
jgi:vacuolar-type H+-ATPase subunit H